MDIKEHFDRVMQVLVSLKEKMNKNKEAYE